MRGMRRVLGVAAALILLPAAPASAEVVTVGVGDDFFDPQEVQIAVGDTVRWVINQDSIGNHSITSKRGEEETFESDPGVDPLLLSHPPGYEFNHTFTKDNVEVEYLCRSHPITMVGTVKVGAPVADTDPPAVRAARARVTRRAVKIGFNLSEDARVVLKVAAAKKPKRALRTVRKRLSAGKRAIGVKRKGLKPGRYRATLSATDAEGNTSRLARTAFRIRPSR